ncbi:MAG: hypothetical protein H7840_06160 [Alphaproteobacteria bacterium]
MPIVTPVIRILVRLLLTALIVATPAAAQQDGRLPAPSLSRTFAEAGYGYSIRYPGPWTVSRSGPYTVVFAGAPDTPAYYSTVSIANRLSPNPGEPQRGAAAVMSRYLEELTAKARNARVLKRTSFMRRGQGVTLDGYQAVTEFVANGGGHMRQWVVVVPRRSGTVVHTWMYTAELDDFEESIPIARAMLDSWTIDGTDAR